jgi:hypothetical protein
MIKNRDIVIVGLQPWDIEIGSNCKNLALEFSKNNRVLYINSPLDRLTAIRQKNKQTVKKRLQIINKKRPSFYQIKENLWNFYPRKK